MERPAQSAQPVFSEPWQAQVFALTVELSARGHFTWSEWSAALGEELKASSGAGAGDSESGYYRCWLAALERLIAAKGIA